MEELLINSGQRLIPILENMSTMRNVSLEKSPYGIFITCNICFECHPSNTGMKKYGIVKMINTYLIYNLKNHVESSKVHGKILERKQFHEYKESKDQK